MIALIMAKIINSYNSDSKVEKETMYGQTLLGLDVKFIIIEKNNKEYFCDAAFLGLNKKQEEKNMNVGKMTYDEKFVIENTSVTYYFMGDSEIIKELYPGKYPKAESTEISIEVVDGNINTATVMISPTEDGEDYDWNDITLSLADIEKLLQKSDFFLN